MIILIESILILSYMLNDSIGMFLMLLITTKKALDVKKNGQLINCIFELLIMSLPVAYIGIAGLSMHQLFSWYNLFLIVFLFAFGNCFSYRIPFSKNTILSITVIVGCLIINLLWAEEIGNSLAEISQILIMLIPIIVVHSARNKFPIKKNDVIKLLRLYADVCVATAIGMLVQYGLYTFAHRQVGIIQFTGASRVAFFGLFRGASILPIYMGVGILYFYIECFENKVTITVIMKIAVLFIASILNTSRTAIFTIFLVMALIYLKQLFKAPSLKGGLLAVAGGTSIYLAIDYIMSLRSKLSGFLDLNGRMITWRNGLDIWGANVKNILLGEGFTGGRWQGITKPHNMIIQTLSQCGIIVTVIILCMILKYLFDNKKNKYIYIAIYIIASGMLVTDFYANAFTTVVFILIDLASATSNREA